MEAFPQCVLVLSASTESGLRQKAAAVKDGLDACGEGLGLGLSQQPNLPYLSSLPRLDTPPAWSSLPSLTAPKPVINFRALCAGLAQFEQTRCRVPGDDSYRLAVVATTAQQSSAALGRYLGMILANFFPSFSFVLFAFH